MWLLLLIASSLAGGLEGRVSTDQGVALQGAMVCAYDLRLDAECTETDADGAWMVDGLEAGAWRVRVVPAYGLDAVERFWPEGHTYCEGSLQEVPADDTIRALDFVLPDGGQILGRLLDERGQPVVGAIFSATAVDEYLDGATRLGISDDKGSFSVRGLDAPDSGEALYVLKVEVEGWPDQWLGAAYSEDSAEVLPLLAGQDLDVGDWSLLPGIVVQGRVTGPDGPIEDASVHVYSTSQVLSVATAADGTYEAVGLPPGLVIPWAWAEGYASTYYPDADRPGESLPVKSEGQLLTGADIELPYESVFHGIVEIPGGLPDGRDIEEITALLYNDTSTGGWGAPVEADGSFLLEGLHGASYSLFLFAADAGLLDDYIRDPQGEIVWYQVPPEGELPVQSVALPLGGLLSGTVTDDEGEPVYGAWVYATESGSGDVETAATARDGSFQVEGLKDGNYRLETRYSPYCDADPGYVTVWWDGTVNESLAASIFMAPGEIREGLDLTQPRDNDHDQMGDAWEIENGLDTGRDDADEDLDGDGYTNLEEYLLGTDPNEAYEKRGHCGCATPRGALSGLLALLCAGMGIVRRRTAAP